MKYFNSQILDEIKSVLDISILVERFVPLKKTGSRYIGICPFHQDTKPSMYVTPSMGIYKCFACGAGGDHFKFVQEYEKLDFPAAVETVAEIAAYKLPEKKLGKEEFKSAQEKKSLLDINFTASHFFQDQLFKNQDAYKYLSSRGLLEPTIKTFQLGWAPQSWDALIKHGQKNGLSRVDLIKAGLVVEKENGKNYDKFRGRIMYPIHNLSQKTIAFGGRSLDPEEKAKYMNSPETELYHKSEVLYGLSHVKNDLADAGSVLFVEGYMDFLQLWQAGIKNVLSVSGTALTLQHANLLKRYIQKAYLVFDADEAGIKAAERSIPILLKVGIEPQVLLLPEGEDPDSYVKNFGAASFIDKLKESQSFPHFYKWRWNISENLSPEAKANTLIRYQEILTNIQDPVIIQGYQKQIAGLLSIPEQQLRIPQPKQNPNQLSTPTNQTPQPISEWKMLGIILKNGDLVPIAYQAVDLYSFQNNDLAEILDLIFLHNPEGKDTPWNILFEEASPTQKNILAFYNPDQFPLGDLAFQEFAQLTIKQEHIHCQAVIQNLNKNHPEAIEIFPKLLKIRNQLDKCWRQMGEGMESFAKIYENYLKEKGELIKVRPLIEKMNSN